jgi:arsenite-transporting ATPase
MTALTVVLGPGGVGKTTLSAALALAAAQRGERCAVVTVDPAKRLAQALGRAQLAHWPEAVTGAPKLFAATLDRGRAWDEMVARCGRERGVDPARITRLLANRYFRHLRDELGGSAEIIYADYLAVLLEDGGFDRVVIDTPPAHDALGFLDAPARFARFVDGRILELLIGSGSFRLSRRLVHKVLARLTGQKMLDELIEFLTLSSEVLYYMGDRGRQIAARQRRDDTEFILVTAPDREGEVAARSLAAQLAERSLVLSAALANRIVAEPPKTEWLGAEDPGWSAWAEGRVQARANEAARDQEQIDSLRALLAPVPVSPVLRADAEPASLDDLAALARQIPVFS